MTTHTDDLLRRIANGDQRAIESLLGRHRGRLRRMIEVRMDRRIAARIDPSDVVQEALVEAAARLPEIANQEVPFYVCLRRLAWERLVQIQRQHIGAQKRSIEREINAPQLSDASTILFANQFVGRDSTPSCQAIKREVRTRVREALAELGEANREILLMRHLEQLSIPEIAAALEVSPEAARSRYRRALEQLHRFLSDLPDSSL